MSLILFLHAATGGKALRTAHVFATQSELIDAMHTVTAKPKKQIQQGCFTAHVYSRHDFSLFLSHGSFFSSYFILFGSFFSAWHAVARFVTRSFLLARLIAQAVFV